ncbi:HIG1 domain family member 2A, mitochondrial [Calliopsis andreniformis]|uniref:HIG1 domain family member 2A, mitochondrial n=1 Tax=Calliopsis andreniformis TaxID=337506 RepID=UPI003FCCE0B1
MSSKTTTNSQTFDEFDWVRVREELDPGIIHETFRQKLLRKTLENPFIPIGTVATVSALVCGLYHFYKGNSKMSNYMMRARVGAQAFTICAFLGGFMITSSRKQSAVSKS